MPQRGHDGIIIFLEPFDVGFSLFDGLFEGSFGGSLVGMLPHEVLELPEAVIRGEAPRDTLDNVRQREGTHAVVAHDFSPICPEERGAGKEGNV